MDWVSVELEKWGSCVQCQSGSRGGKKKKSNCSSVSPVNLSCKCIKVLGSCTGQNVDLSLANRPILPRMSECSMGSWVAYISLPGQFNATSFLNPNRATRHNDLNYVLLHLLSVAKHTALLSGDSFQRAFWPYLLTLDLAIKDIWFPIECFGWSATPELPQALCNGSGTLPQAGAIYRFISYAGTLSYRCVRFSMLFPSEGFCSLLWPGR